MCVAIACRLRVLDNGQDVFAANYVNGISTTGSGKSVAVMWRLHDVRFCRSTVDGSAACFCIPMLFVL